MFEFESLVDDIAMLTYAKELRPYMTNSQRTVYFKSLERVQSHGQKLFEDAVDNIDYDIIKRRVTEFETMHPNVVK